VKEVSCLPVCTLNVGGSEPSVSARTATVGGVSTFPPSLDLRRLGF